MDGITATVCTSPADYTGLPGGQHSYYVQGVDLAGNATTEVTGQTWTVVGGTDWASVSLGDFHSCGERTDGTLHCWGNNQNGQLGDGTTGNKSEPVQVLNP